MTREKEIKKQADIYTDDASNYAEWSDDGGWSDTNDIELIERAFIEGAKYADKTMLDRACEWLSIYYPNVDRMGIDEFITAFRQAMEEEL